MQQGRLNRKSSSGFGCFKRQRVAIVVDMTNQEPTYAVKFSELQPFIIPIFTTVKKDIRDEHLRTDRGFFKRNFAGKELGKLTVDDLIAVYSKFIAAGYEQISEFIANRWILRNLDIYNFFESELKQYSQKFDQIDELDSEFATSLINEATGRFGPENTYIFSVLNFVALPGSLLKQLRDNAIHAHATVTAATT